MPEALTQIDDLTHLLLSRFRAAGHAQVEDYNRFEYVTHTVGTVTVLRENGNRADVRLSALTKAIEAVRADPAIYDKGPGSLREHGITHVSSPVWAMLHLATLEEFTV